MGLAHQQNRLQRIDDLHAFRHAVYGALGWEYRAPSLPPSALMPLQAWRMITSRSGMFKCRGALTGTGFNGQSFSIVDVTAKQREADYIKTEETTLSENHGFRGVIVSLSHPASFAGRTIIMQDKGVFNPTTVDRMKRVGFASSEFERIFEVYSDDQVEARALITPDLMERMIGFSQELLGHRLQCVFLGNQMHLALDIDDTFEFSHDYDPPEFERTKNIFLSEAGTVCILLEKLQALQAVIGRDGRAGADQSRKTHYLSELDRLAKILSSLRPGIIKDTNVPKGMEHAQYLFCDSLKGLLYPRL